MVSQSIPENGLGRSWCASYLSVIICIRLAIAITSRKVV